MCLAIPGKVIKIKGKTAQVKQADHCHWLDTSLIESSLKVGDYLLSYQNTAINKISVQEAKQILKLINQ